jgi:hypothetical protein
MTITASSASVTYGDAAPTITPSFSPNVDPGGVSCDTSYSQGLGAGSYGTICSGGSSSNYSYTYNGGTVSVGRIALHVTCASREINVIDPQPTLDPPSVSGSFYGSDGWTSGPTCTTAYVAGTDLAGPYAITPVATANPNYTVTPTDGLLTVDP